MNDALKKIYWLYEKKETEISPFLGLFKQEDYKHNRPLFKKLTRIDLTAWTFLSYKH